MKLASLIAGVLILAAASVRASAPPPDAQFSTGDKKDASASADKSRSPTPDPPQIDSGRRGGLEDLVEIAGVTQQKPDASGSRKVTVRVHYVLVHYPKGVLSLGFNLKSATKFIQVTSQSVLSGEDEMEMSATVTPVAWPKGQPFKLSVSLSAEPHPGEWSLLAASSQPLKPVAASAPAKP
jgi:hypothetical protein